MNFEKHIIELESQVFALLMLDTAVDEKRLFKIFC